MQLGKARDVHYSTRADFALVDGERVELCSEQDGLELEALYGDSSDLSGISHPRLLAGLGGLERKGAVFLLDQTESNAYVAYNQLTRDHPRGKLEVRLGEQTVPLRTRARALTLAFLETGQGDGEEIAPHARGLAALHRQGYLAGSPTRAYLALQASQNTGSVAVQIGNQPTQVGLRELSRMAGDLCELRRADELVEQRGLPRAHVSLLVEASQRSLEERADLLAQLGPQASESLYRLVLSEAAPDESLLEAARPLGLVRLLGEGDPERYRELYCQIRANPERLLEANGMGKMDCQVLERAASDLMHSGMNAPESLETLRQSIAQGRLRLDLQLFPLLVGTDQPGPALAALRRQFPEQPPAELTPLVRRTGSLDDGLEAWREISRCPEELTARLAVWHEVARENPDWATRVLQSFAVDQPLQPQWQRYRELDQQVEDPPTTLSLQGLPGPATELAQAWKSLDQVPSRERHALVRLSAESDRLEQDRAGWEHINQSSQPMELYRRMLQVLPDGLTPEFRDFAPDEPSLLLRLEAWQLTDGKPELSRAWMGFRQHLGSDAATRLLDRIPPTLEPAGLWTTCQPVLKRLQGQPAEAARQLGRALDAAHPLPTLKLLGSGCPVERAEEICGLLHRAQPDHLEGQVDDLLGLAAPGQLDEALQDYLFLARRVPAEHLGPASEVYRRVLGSVGSRDEARRVVVALEQEPPEAAEAHFDNYLAVLALTGKLEKARPLWSAVRANDPEVARGAIASVASAGKGQWLLLSGQLQRPVEQPVLTRVASWLERRAEIAPLLLAGIFGPTLDEPARQSLLEVVLDSPDSVVHLLATMPELESDPGALEAALRLGALTQRAPAARVPVTDESLQDRLSLYQGCVEAVGSPDRAEDVWHEVVAWMEPQDRLAEAIPAAARLTRAVLGAGGPERPETLVHQVQRERQAGALSGRSLARVLDQLTQALVLDPRQTAAELLEAVRSGPGSMGISCTGQRLTIGSVVVPTRRVA